MSKPVIGIDASRIMVDQRTGTENYSFQLTRHLVDLDGGSAFAWRGYLNGDAAALPDEDRTRAIAWRSIPLPRVWTHARLSWEMATHRPDLLFVPAHVVPILHPRSVVTIHDLGYLHFPEAHTPGRVRSLDLSTRWSIRAARHIIVPSAFTREDLIARYNVSPAKITVVHHGVDERFRHGQPDASERLRLKHGLVRPFVLAVGTVQPRKNLPFLARAVKMLIDRNIDCDLVIAGKPGWLANQVLRELAATGLGDRLRMLSYVDDDDVPALYRSASCFVLPSRFEGFGMPALEAMASGTPTIATDSSSLPEIVATGGVVVPLDDDETLAAELARILTDPVWATTMRDRAIARSQDFSWERSARETLAVLKVALAG
jgi:glycosyltransferase involved in cell wall biosynthesis